METVKTRTVRNSKLFTALCGDLLASGRSVRFQASGASMGEAVRHGDTICVAPVATDAVNEGDILLARPNGQWTAHRVVDIDKTSSEVTLRGDANSDLDQVVRAANISGRVVAIER